ncbi:MAG: OmpA family protein [Saprospiraceae bacterium]|nr:OmpA family protein [Saprospiraceae bacterium]
MNDGFFNRLVFKTLVLLTGITPFKSICQEADNLVPNPSFSEYKEAMEFIPQFSDEHFTKNVAHWYSAVDPTIPPHFVTPYLKPDLGQKPLFADGDSIFVGLILGLGGGVGGASIGVELKQALSSQKKYLVKMRVAIPPISRKSRYPKVLPDNFGVLFSQDKIVATTQERGVIALKPQIDFSGTPLQPFRWIEIEQVFQPEEEGLKFLTLGIFCPNPVSMSFNNFYRYFIDRVSVVETELDITPLMPVAVIPEFKPTPVYFSTGKTEIARHKTALDSLVNYLQLENPEIHIQLTGYADATGAENSNLDLSRKRAVAVYEYLVKNGIDSTRIKVKWGGEINAQPADQMAKNRRVDIALLEPPASLPANEPPPSIPADWQSVYRFSAELEKLKNAPFNEIAFTCIGEYEHAVAKSGNSEPEPVAPEDQEALKNGIQADAVSYLVKRAEQEKIILINEAHNRPKHRAFVALLLDSLYQRGYRYLGLEMLFPADTLINSRGYPILSSGLYSQEPVAGELIRMALETGYEVFGYDANAQEIEAARETWAAKDESFAQLADFAQEMNARDRVQANKIAEKMKRNKNGKYLILAGFGHIRENIIGDWHPMAYQLKKYHQIDPFTVDQITGDMDMANSPFTPFKHNNKSLIILQAGNQQPFSFKTYDLFSDAFVACFDLQVVHPKTQAGKHGRPTWLEWHSKREAISTSKFIPSNTPLPCLVLAYKDAEDIRQAVPADVVELRKDYSPLLMLRPGKYNVLIKCVTGQIFTKKIITE